MEDQEPSRGRSRYIKSIIDTYIYFGTYYQVYINQHNKESEMRQMEQDGIPRKLSEIDIRMGTYAEEGVLTLDEGIILGINNQRFHITIKEN